MTIRKVTLEIDLGNEAFQDDPGWEVARILKAQAIRLEQGSMSTLPGTMILRDHNGNPVGKFILSDKE